LSEDEKLAIVASSQALPEPLIEQMTPGSASNFLELLAARMQHTATKTRLKSNPLHGNAKRLKESNQSFGLACNLRLFYGPPPRSTTTSNDTPIPASYFAAWAY
jgi:hypothetical protein